ncbi:beta-ribofuranosylaminobenzene 5'-phosphate synthase family protein [Thermococcus thioreducens]|uniref:Beta-ribofuranosylaminobenzene 5'-phosphate synthase n=1 Tax=Thermococcus thioreducens TaxID=277988 RepID=A0A0Q2M0Y2_9EURY|nr:beta-ribofuranosylaminobenzene 5'-phosphate synthase family protein [Thermococcus thioreducens]ASJ12127.1 GHMP kinase [Thermococcus thioreducens]KQH81530.1 GHMP kinase [Thermococcus thioreducens]SEV96481.1 beta-ribofuranosylaminobenzene 5'-phosphate synthase [Thermococcus thioreducens]
MIIRTPRRLHLGLIDPSATLGRRFGSLGVALEDGYEVRIVEGEAMEIAAEGEDRETIEFAIKRMNSAYETGVNYIVEVRKAIPRHVGLGSTTQLSLAVGTAIARLNNLNVPIEELARVLGRGRNGGAGVYSFAYGGFVIDGGVRNGIPPLIFREEFPKDWAFLLVIPELKPGLDEEEEKPVMAGVVGRVDVAMEISHRILLGLLPALKERDVRTFGEHLSAIQRLVGKHFEPYQGGEFREDVKLILDFLAEKTYGCGQSSWGPTVYGLIRRGEFGGLRAEAHDFLREHGIKAKVELGLPNNTGAEIIGESAFIERLIRNVAGE